MSDELKPLGCASNIGSKASGVVGKSGEYVDPVTYAAPRASAWTSPGLSAFAPPRRVPYIRLSPPGDSFVTKPSSLEGSPLKVVSNAPGVVGKSGDDVEPVTNAAPAW